MSRTIWEDLVFFDAPQIIVEQTRKEKGIIIGGQALQRHIGMYARPSFDFDILVRNPKKSAMQLSRRLNLQAHENIFYVRPSKYHPQTNKVIYVGDDRKIDTADDKTIADYTPYRPIMTKTIGGVRYAALNSIIKEKKMILKDNTYAYRHAKDLEDIRRVREYERIQRNLR